MSFNKSMFEVFFLPIVFSVIFVTVSLAKEQIIQQEKMSYEKCLKVITVSADKLSIAPTVSDQYEKKRIAVFTLSDGKLTIRCDGQEGSITVSTEMN